MTAVSGVIRFGAMPSGTATAPGRTGGGTWLKVARFAKLAARTGSIVVPAIVPQIGFLGALFMPRTPDDAPPCYAWDTMSGINGDKARFHRVRKHKLALRERSQAIRKELAAAAAASKTPDAPPTAQPADRS
jgi:hypothetical protein